MLQLGNRFSHTKNDQDGSKNFKPQHCDTNPEDFASCPITAQFECMTCFPENLQDTDNGQLFSGTEKEERFRKIIKRLLHGHEGDMIYDRCRLLRGALSLTKVSYNIMTSPVCSMAVVRFSQHLVPGSRVPVPWYIIPTGLTHITWYRYGTWWTSYLERSTGNWYQVP